MTESRRPYGAPQPPPIDDNEDRMGSINELDFEEDQTHESISDLFTPEELEKHVPGQPAGHPRLSASTLSDDESNEDDLEPDMLIMEDGARDAWEAAEGADEPADWDLSVVDESEIGGSDGLDEAELAEIDPVGPKR